MSAAPEYTDIHRAILQACMGQGTIEAKVFVEIFEEICQNSPQNARTMTTVDDAIASINKKIGQFDQRILKQEYGLTKEEFYVFHSTAKTSMSKLQNTYSEDELDFFKLIVQKIVESEELKVTPIEALNLSNATPGKINKLRAQKLLDGWIACHLFCKHTDSQIYLGAKLLTEFRELLQNMELDNLRSCMLCENIAIWGEHCGSCNTIFHQSCIGKFLSRSEKCPSCKEKWPIAT